MSRQLSESRAIPTRTVLINDTTQLPHDYCTTPGGTLFSTTPGGMWLHRLYIFFSQAKWHDYLPLVFVHHYTKCSHRCGLGWLVIPSQQKQRMAPLSVLQSRSTIGWFTVQRF